MKMPKDKIDEIMFAPCGMNCMVCYKHCYDKKPCDGCLQKDNVKPIHCRKCKIKDCVLNKNINYCYECSQYPCKLLANLEKSYKQRYSASLLKNGYIVKEKGLTEFLLMQKQKYTCDKCGGIISIHDFKCSECDNIFNKHINKIDEDSIMSEPNENK